VMLILFVLDAGDNASFAFSEWPKRPHAGYSGAPYEQMPY